MKKGPFLVLKKRALLFSNQQLKKVAFYCLLQTRFDILALHRRNRFKRDLLWTSSRALANVGAVPKAFQIHLLHHVGDACVFFRVSLRHERQVRNLGRSEQ